MRNLGVSVSWLRNISSTVADESRRFPVVGDTPLLRSIARISNNQIGLTECCQAQNLLEYSCGLPKRPAPPLRTVLSLSESRTLSAYFHA